MKFILLSSVLNVYLLIIVTAQEEKQNGSIPFENNKIGIVKSSIAQSKSTLIIKLR
jgi:hypothetical protein